MEHFKTKSPILSFYFSYQLERSNLLGQNMFLRGYLLFLQDWCGQNIALHASPVDNTSTCVSNFCLFGSLICFSNFFSLQNLPKGEQRNTRWNILTDWRLALQIVQSIFFPCRYACVLRDSIIIDNFCIALYSLGTRSLSVH